MSWVRVTILVMGGALLIGCARDSEAPAYMVRFDGVNRVWREYDAAVETAYARFEEAEQNPNEASSKSRMEDALTRRDSAIERATREAASRIENVKKWTTEDVLKIAAARAARDELQVAGNARHSEIIATFYDSEGGKELLDKARAANDAASYKALDDAIAALLARHADEYAAIDMYYEAADAYYNDLLRQMIHSGRQDAP